MAFTDNQLSEIPMPDLFVGATADPTIDRLRDVEDGPIALQDPSMGSMYQPWTAWYEDGAVWLKAKNQPTPTKLLDFPVTNISIAFNQNGDLHHTWVDTEGNAYLSWFNSLINAIDITQLPAGTKFPYLTLDDKREVNASGSDVLLFYLNAEGELCMRRQRDRFGDEFVLDEGPYIGLEKVGMNVGYRLQIQLLQSTKP